jgi:hypothetical protein
LISRIFHLKKKDGLDEQPGLKKMMNDIIDEKQFYPYPQLLEKKG